jgi:radical SAM superfamily enzyme YgiQ (UPF0313 family)
VISFLQNKNQSLALSICSGKFLPKARRFSNSEDLEWAFGTMGTHDMARHLSTLYLEDLGDLITETIDENFGFSRYAERLARTATSFEILHQSLQEQSSLISKILEKQLEKHLNSFKPDVVCISAPFPGNVFGAFKCGQYIKTKYPDVKIIFGGGYANTELRSLYDDRVFKYIDFVCLDDGEAPLAHLLEYLEGKRDLVKLKRTFCLTNGVVQYINGSQEFDIPQKEVGTPDYGDFLLDRYLSVIEIVNPMHRLWSDGRWNKLTLAHGCYWGKCSFCDVSLDYIQRYEPVSASLLCNRIETIINQTGQNGFHFVDEAAPPALMRDLAIEIIKRKLTVVWWTNIRFEKRFTSDLCVLLRASGCIAISGGLEVASDRLLDKMKKGVTVAQVARVADNFTKANIMVHAYLMYGFPTQTDQETIDSLEMVRQMIKQGVIQSGFWHQFTMTAHSPVGLDPMSFGVENDGPVFEGFAENDLFHIDKKGAQHELFSEGLKLSIYNYMQGLGLDEALSTWFEFEVPRTSIEPDYIENELMDLEEDRYRNHDLVMWIGGEIVELIIVPIKSKDKLDELSKTYAEIIVSGLEEDYSLFFKTSVAQFLVEYLPSIDLTYEKPSSYLEFKLSFEKAGLNDFEEFILSEDFTLLKSKGLLII